MIPDDFNTAHADIIKLVRTFADNHDKYLAASYNESAARKDFIDKFFIALGWDVNHDEQANPYEQEVKVERNVAVTARVKKADYAFFLTPDFHAERFFVEAKRRIGIFIFVAIMPYPVFIDVKPIVAVRVGSNKGAIPAINKLIPGLRVLRF
jgi:hypothetical protein